MESWLIAYTRLILRHPRTIIAAIIVITGLLMTQMQYLRINYDPDNALPARHPLVLSADRIADIFGGKYTSAIALAVRNGDIYTPATLAKIQRITEKIKGISGVKPATILSLASENVKDIEGMPDCMRINPMMASIPQTPAGIDELKKRVARNADVLEGVIVSRDAKVAVILSDYESMKKVEGAGALCARWEEIIKPERDDNTSFHITGVPVLLYWMDVYSARVAMLMPLAILIIGLLHYHAFRTIQGLVIPLVTAILSVVWALGLLGFFRTNLDPYNLITPILVLAVAAGHSVQILKRYYEEYHRLQDNTEAVVTATSKVGVAMLTAGFVAAAGLFSLVTFQAPSIRNFGIFSACGIISALILEMTFIPCLRVLLRPPSSRQALREREETVFDTLLNALASAVRRRSGAWVFGAAVVLLIASLAFATRVEINNSFAAYFPEESQVMRDLNVVNKRLGGAFVLQVMVEAREDDAFKSPQALKAMEDLQRYIDTLPEVGRTISLADYLKKMNQAMHNGDATFMRLPDSRNMAAQYLLLYGSPEDFEHLVDPQYRRAVITVFMKDDSFVLTRNMFRDIMSYSDQHIRPAGLKVELGGGIADTHAAGETVIHGKMANIVQVSGMIFLVSSLVFLSFFGGFLVIVPLLLTVCINMGVMGASGIWLNMATATISAVALSMGADYGIYYLFRMREELQHGKTWEQAFEISQITSGKAILYVASAITLGYAITIFSGFSVHVYLGILVPLTMFFSSLSALTLAPALLLRIRPKFLKKQEPDS